MKAPKLFQLICDYGVGDPAFAEVIQRFKCLDPFAQCNPVPVPEFSTLATGFWIAQLGLWNPVDHVVIFSNTAPRHDDHQPRDKNEGEKFVYVQLDNGLEMGVVNSGYSLSFVKYHIKKLAKIKTQENGSQFRSRDYYPSALLATLNEERGLGADLNKNLIPDMPKGKIAFIDGYGNIKTTIRACDVKLSSGDKIKILINHVYQDGVYTDGIFAVNSGNLTLAPGSSGDPQNPFLEVVLRRGSSQDSSASDIFNHPKVELEVKVNI